jgi:hypothetical protein
MGIRSRWCKHHTAAMGHLPRPGPRVPGSMRDPGRRHAAAAGGVTVMRAVCDGVTCLVLRGDTVHIGEGDLGEMLFLIWLRVRGYCILYWMCCIVLCMYI